MTATHASHLAERRLLIVTHYFSTHGGGVENVAVSLANTLLDQNQRLNIVWCAGNCDPSPPTHSRLRLKPLSVWNGLESKLGIPYPIPLPTAILRLWQEVGACDLVHLHDFSYASNAIAALFCQMQGKPYFVTQHISLVPYKNPLLRTALEILNGTLGRFVLKRAARVVFYSRIVERYFGRFVRRSKREFIPNGIASQTFYPVSPEERRSLRQKLEIEEGAPIVAFVGRFVEKKGVPFLLDLTKHFPHVRWLLAGKGPLDPGDGTLPNVTVWRDKSGQDIGDMMRVADVLALPSRGEGFPLVIQEALACGTAVLTAQELAQSQPTAVAWLTLKPLGKSNDLERWSTTLQTMLDEVTNTPQAAQEQRTQRAAWANHEWNWERCAQAYQHLMDDITAGNHS